MLNSFNVSGTELMGLTVAIAKGLDTMDQSEGLNIVRLCGGIGRNTVNQSTNILVIGNTTKQSMDEKSGETGEAIPAYISDARAFGVKVIDEFAFWELTGIDNGNGGVANRWVIIDDELEGGKVDVSNEPAWDGHKAPYKLFLQRWTKKTTTDGGWKIIASGPLSGEGYPEFSAQPWYRNPEKIELGRDPASNEEYDYRQLIGKVVVVNNYAPKNCAYLFDGLENCAEFDLRKLDFSHATSMECMFRGCTSVRYLMDIGRIDTSHVTSMHGTFFGCGLLKAVDMLGWDISSLKTASSMFENSPAFALVNKDTANVFESDAIDAERMFNAGTLRGPWLKSSAI